MVFSTQLETLSAMMLLFHGMFFSLSGDWDTKWGVHICKKTTKQNKNKPAKEWVSRKMVRLQNVDISRSTHLWIPSTNRSLPFRLRNQPLRWIPFSCKGRQQRQISLPLALPSNNQIGYLLAGYVNITYNAYMHTFDIYVIFFFF